MKRARFLKRGNWTNWNRTTRKKKNRKI